MEVYQLAFSQWGRFIPIVILITTGNVLIPVSWKSSHPDEWDGKKWNKGFLGCFSVSLIFSVIAIVFLILIYIKMGDTRDPLGVIFKQGYISWTLGFLLWNLIDCCFELDYYNYQLKLAKGKLPKYHGKARKTAGYICIIIYGILVGLFSFLKDDVICPIIGMFMVMGQMVISAKADNKPKEFEDIYLPGESYRSKGHLACSTIIWILLLALEVFIILAKYLHLFGSSK